jgi:hypothetical protein
VRGARALFAVAAASLGLGSAGSLWPVVEAPSRSPAIDEPVVFSFFAVGDVGRSGTLHRGRHHVADAVRRLDAERPASALVLLGDYFHPDGLDPAEPGSRVREVLGEPFGEFETRPLVGVLGNHDRPKPDSNTLVVTGRMLRRWLPGWRGADAPVERFRLAPGVDVVTYDSSSDDADLPRRLENAIRAAPGPWRIVVGHHPLRADWGYPAEQGLADGLREAVARAGVPVQLAVAGHDHNLQVLDLEEAGLGLQVISGSGSGHRRLRGEVADRWLGVDELGMARVDLIDRPGGDVLRVTVYSVESGPVPSSWPRPWPSILRVEGVFEADASGRAWPLGA